MNSPDPVEAGREKLILRHAALAWPPHCPSWIGEYVEEHTAAVKGWGNGTQAILYDCRDDRQAEACGGIGDRMRSMLETLKVCYVASHLTIILTSTFSWPFILAVPSCCVGAILRRWRTIWSHPESIGE